MHQIIAVEFVDKSAFGKANLGQIITRNSRGNMEVVYFRAKVRIEYILCYLFQGIIA